MNDFRVLRLVNERRRAFRSAYWFDKMARGTGSMSLLFLAGLSVRGTPTGVAKRCGQRRAELNKASDPGVPL